MGKITGKAEIKESKKEVLGPKRIGRLTTTLVNKIIGKQAY